ncbi:MAG: hypothetical protein K5739_10125 [Lachnospiraceae bacterium]|nr:hypothetical protein [Lachnospiraceae bacterium]
MQKKIDKLILIPYVMLILFLVIVIGFGFVHPDSDGALRGVFSAPVMVLLLIAGVLLYLLVMGVLFRRLPGEEGKSPCYMLIIASVLAVGLQVFLTVHYPLQIWWDNTSVLTSAISNVYNMPECFDFEYFNQLGHQNCFLGFTVFMVFIGKLLGVSLAKLPLFLSLADVAAVDLSAAGILMILDRVKGRRAMQRVLIFMLLCPGTYLWCAYYYTTNISLLFASTYFFLYYACMQKEHSLKFYVCFGALAAFSSQFRATLLLCVIASLVFYLFRRPKKPLILLLAGGVGALIVICFLNAAYKEIIPDYDEEARFPVTHWVMMSFQGNGEYNDEDLAFTASFPTHAQKAEATKAELMRRIKEMGPSGVAALFFRKTVHNWSYGNHSYYPMFNRNDRLTDLLWTPDHFFSFYLQQIFHLTQLLLVLFGMGKALLTFGKREEKISYDDLIRIFLLGGFCFYLLWETYPYYSVGFLPVLFYLSADGLAAVEKTAGLLFASGEDASNTAKSADTNALRKKLSGRGIAAAGVAVAAAAGILAIFAKTPFPATVKPVVTQKKFHSMYYMENGSLFTQSFVADRGFDTIRFWIGKKDLAKETGGLYDIMIEGEKSGRVFLERYDTRGMHSIDEFTRTFPRVNVQGSERFSIIITKVEEQDGNKDTNPLGIGAYDLPVDAYLYGSLCEDGTDTGMDMFFNVTDGGPDDIITLY